MRAPLTAAPELNPSVTVSGATIAPAAWALGSGRWFKAAGAQRLPPSTSAWVGSQLWLHLPRFDCTHVAVVQRAFRHGRPDVLATVTECHERSRSDGGSANSASRHRGHRPRCTRLPVHNYVLNRQAQWFPAAGSGYGSARCQPLTRRCGRVARRRNRRADSG